MSVKSKQAAETFGSGFNCTQSVLSVFAEDFGINKDLCLRLASPFGAGIACRQETCGAVTGALMAIGLKYGKGENGTEEDKANAYKQSQHFVSQFMEKNQTICCRELLGGLDINTTKGMAKIHSLDLFKRRCSKYVQESVEITELILGK